MSEEKDLSALVEASYARIYIGNAHSYRAYLVKLDERDFGSSGISSPEIIYGDVYRTSDFSFDWKFDWSDSYFGIVPENTENTPVENVHAYKFFGSNPSCTIIKIMLPKYTFRITFLDKYKTEIENGEFLFYKEIEGQATYNSSYYGWSWFRYEQTLDFYQREPEHTIHEKAKYAHLTDRPNVHHEMLNDSPVSLHEYLSRGNGLFGGYGSQMDQLVNENILTRDFQMQYLGKLHPDNLDLQLNLNGPQLIDPQCNEAPIFVQGSLNFTHQYFHYDGGELIANIPTDDMSIILSINNGLAPTSDQDLGEFEFNNPST